MARYYGEGDELQLALNFPFFFSDLDLGMRATVETTLGLLPAGACPVWAGSNHDDSRFPTRWCGGNDRRVRLALTVLCTLPGTTLLYYGDELGLGDVDVPVADERDPMSWGGTGVRGSRDRARTPMPWEAGPGMGFTRAGVTPWLPFGDRRGLSVAEQMADRSSVLWLTRALLHLRTGSLDCRAAPGPDGVSGPTPRATSRSRPTSVSPPAGSPCPAARSSPA